MKWPWISRALHDHLLAESAKRNVELGSRLALMEARYDTLADKYTDKYTAKPELPSLVRKGPDIVTQALLARSGNDPRLRKHYAEYVAEQRAMQVDEEAIAAAIRIGEDDMGGLP